MEHLFKSGPAIAVNLTFTHSKLTQIQLDLSKRFLCHWDTEGDPTPIIKWLEQYASKQPPSVHNMLDLSKMPPFHRQALECLQKIPFGETASYGEVAARVGNPRAARAVGTACHHNPYLLLIPCHRVITSSGKLGGFAINMKIKERLLEFEESYV
jgi:methylated-DNA-[protein]-cysteine S-methyltransferase